MATETLGSNFQSADPGVDWENPTNTLTSGLTAHLTGESLKEPPTHFLPLNNKLIEDPWIFLL